MGRRFEIRKGLELVLDGFFFIKSVDVFFISNESTWRAEEWGWMHRCLILHYRVEFVTSDIQFLMKLSIFVSKRSCM